MTVYDMAMIELIADDDSAIISGGGFDFRDIKLSVDPDDLFSDELDLKVIESAFAPGGMAGAEEYPVRTLTLPFNLYDTGAGIEATVSRFRKLWRAGRTLLWQVTTQESGLRLLQLRRSQGIKFSPSQDWNMDGYAKAVVTAVALNPFYESAPLTMTVTNPSNGSNTFWLPVTNPTDQKAWPEWSLKPNGATTFSFADFSFGNDQEIDPDWAPGRFASRMIVTPSINVMWSVMSDPLMDTYVAADLSNANGQMQAVEPLFWIPPYTGTDSNGPIMLPVTINGPAGSQVKLTLRRFWSAESGLE